MLRRGGEEMSTKKFVSLALVLIIVALSVCEPLITAAHAQNLRLRVERIQPPRASSTNVGGSMSQIWWQADLTDRIMSTPIATPLESQGVPQLSDTPMMKANSWSGIGVRRTRGE